MFRRYTQGALIGRLIVIIAAIGFIVVLAANAGGGQKPEDIRAFVDAKGAESLALRGWMQDNGIDTIALLNKSNRNYGNGVSLKVGRLYCFFDGPGTDTLFDPSQLNGLSTATEKALELETTAEEYGAYVYQRHADRFDITISGDPFHRPGGMEGTSVFYANAPGAGANAEDLGNGWYMVISESTMSKIRIDTHSELFMLAIITAAFVIVVLIMSLLYKRYECDAEVIMKRSEYIGDRPRIENMIRGVRAGILEDYTIYIITFLDERHERLNFYVSKTEYDRIEENTRGRLVYKRLWKRYRYISFRTYNFFNETAEEALPGLCGQPLF